MKVMVALAGSQILYHIIDLKHAVAALRADKFNLAQVVSSETMDFEARFGDGKPHYFMSLARTKDNDYFRKNSYGSNRVIFVLDGQKMNANFKIKPIDYWGGNEYTKDDETEDRLITTKSAIPSLRYIKEIHFSASKSSMGNQSRSLAILAKRNKIPLFQYENAGQLILMDKRKAIKLDVADDAPRKLSERFGKSYAKSTGRAEAWWDAIAFPEDKTRDPYKSYVEGAKDKLRRKYRNEVYGILSRARDPQYFIQDIKNDISQRYDVADTEYVQRITRFMRKRQYDLPQLAKYLMEKFQAHAKYKIEKSKEEAKAKFPLAPTFYIYKTDTGYRLDVENYPEWNMESADLDEVTDVVHKFHRDSKNIYDRYDYRIQQMF